MTEMIYNGVRLRLCRTNFVTDQRFSFVGICAGPAQKGGLEPGELRRRLSTPGRRLTYDLGQGAVDAGAVRPLALSVLATTNHAVVVSFEAARDGG